MTLHDNPPPRWAAHPAPAPLALLQRFVNTHAYSGRPDQLGTAPTARVWFRQQEVSTSLTARDLPRLVATREAIREQLRGHGLRHPARAISRPLELALPRPNFTWRQIDDDTITLVGAGRGVERFLNDLAAAIVSASLTDAWRHLKICKNDECQVAFWDHTRNGAARYCSTAGCANRSRQRAFRERASTP